MSLNLLFMDMKRGHVLFPPYDEMEYLFKDILGLYEQIVEGSTRSAKIFQKTPHVPDDFAHSLNFLTMTLRRASGNPIINMKTGESIYHELLLEDGLQSKE